MSIQPPLTSTQVGEAVRAFRSDVCPACGAEKYQSLETFCDECQRLLPMHLSEGISDRARYIELFHPALAHLRQRGVGPGFHQLPPLAESLASSDEDTN